jgi:hypothetical protein
MVLVGCAQPRAPAPVPVEAPAPPPVRRVVPFPRPPIPPTGDATSQEEVPATPHDILVAADQARADAYGYVAWKQSKPENIDRLTTLMQDLNAAVTHMRAAEVRGKYAAPDVRAARTALGALRSFLSNKGD